MAPASGRWQRFRWSLPTSAGAIYAHEILPEIAPDLIDPETGEPIAELEAVIADVTAPSATAQLADETAGNEGLVAETRNEEPTS